jgi:hypothetical protein
MVRVFSLGLGRIFPVDGDGVPWLFQHPEWESGAASVRDSVRISDGWSPGAVTLVVNSVAIGETGIK